MLFQASNNKEKNQIALRPASWAGCPKPRPSHRAPNFREHAGICLTKINLAPNVYFCHYFQVVRVGRATQVRIFYRPPLGSSLGCPLGQSSQRTLGNNKNSVEAKAAGATSSLSKISCLGTSQSCFLFSTWVNNSDHGTATKTDKGTHGGPREIYLYHRNRRVTNVWKSWITCPQHSKNKTKHKKTNNTNTQKTYVSFRLLYCMKS